MAELTFSDMVKAIVKQPSLLNEILSEVTTNKDIQKELGLSAENKEKLKENLSILTKVPKL